MKPKQLPWIQAGYETFALAGPKELKIERLAKVVGKNKSSFYYLFADMEVFIQDLLDYHVKQAKIMAQLEAQATCLEDWIDILMLHKVDFLFSRQLRFHRDIVVFESYSEQVNTIFIPVIVPLWSKLIGLPQHTHLAELFLQLSLEHFFFQINPKTLNPTWINQYFVNTKTLVRQFKQLGKIPSFATLDATV